MGAVIKVFWWITLWIMFSFGCLCAPFIALLIPFRIHSQYLHTILKASDRLVAAELGFSGLLLLSTELAYTDKYKFLRSGIAIIDEQHCADSAYTEGAYCRLKDHSIRVK